MSIPRVYAAISAVTADLSGAGIPKRRINLEEQYAYRGIDDVYDRLSPLLAKHKLCILPRVLERTCTDRSGPGGDLLVSVSIRAAFHLVSAEDGSAHVIESFGEALDAGDKGTSKAIRLRTSTPFSTPSVFPLLELRTQMGLLTDCAKQTSSPSRCKGGINGRWTSARCSASARARKPLTGSRTEIERCLRP